MIINQTNEESDFILRELEKYNNNHGPVVNYRPVNFQAEIDGVFVGGLDGYLAWDVFEIANFIAVTQGNGIGSKLLKEAEIYAKNNGANKMVAVTLDFQAPEFYKKRGFEEIFVIPNFAGKHSQYYFIKRLDKKND